MPMLFPTSPVIGQVFTVGARSWVWNGATWDSPRTDNPPLAIPTGNVIINGGMDINQRGGVATIGLGVTYTLDRWYGYAELGNFTLQQSTNSPQGVGLSNSALATCTTTSTPGTSSFVAIGQRIEGFSSASLGFGNSTNSVTASFWVNSSLTGTYCVAFRNGAINRSYVAEYTISTANTWERKTITLPTDNVGTWERTTGIGLRLDFALSMGSSFNTTPNTWTNGSFTSTTNQVNWMSSNSSRTFLLTGVQLEAGAVATPFRRNAPSIQAELFACQRYYWRWNSGTIYNICGVGSAGSTTVGDVLISHPQMRVTPTSVDFLNLATIRPFISATSVTGLTLTYPGPQSTMVSYTSSNGAAQGQAILLTSNNTTNAFLALNAEL